MIKIVAKIWSEKLIKQIVDTDEEYEIIQYGLSQLFLMILNIVTIVACGILWREWLFCLLLFILIFILRPYAGGYHADTEMNCYIASVGVMNLAMVCRHNMNLSVLPLAFLYCGALGIIWKYAPVANLNNPLEDIEIKKYSGKTKQIIICFCILAGIGFLLKIQVLVDAVFYSFLIISLSILTGKWKYES